MKVPLTVDNRVIQVDSGQNLLQACLENGIYIPNLCYIEGIKRPFASCRLCFVEIEGEKRPVTACTRTITGGMFVRTDTGPVRQLQRSALELLLSVHEVDCGHCTANRKCELQKLARMLKVKLKSDTLDRQLKDTGIGCSHPLLDYYPNRCVLCGKCVYICRERNEKPVLSFIKRGFDTVISLNWDEDTLKIPCKGCLACIEVCPVGAITDRSRSSCPEAGRPA
jgi:bidirectional [NiFe] hydrogenase diaphorase subunit